MKNNSIERIHIGIFGPRNAGKSSLMNAITGQEIAIVSHIAGTTTDPVSKPMEINGLGAVSFIDTAGYDDYGDMGVMRVSKTKQTLTRCDIAIFVLPDTIADDADKMSDAARWFKMIQGMVPDTIAVVNMFEEDPNRIKQIEKALGADILTVNAVKKSNIDALRQRLVAIRNSDTERLSIVKHLVSEQDVVLLVMPQDLQAPQGRLILPQVQTIRELLDNKCIVVSCTTECLSKALASLAAPPKLIVTDSQAFKTVYEQMPKESLLTSFSVLFARIKGDIDSFVRGAAAIDSLSADSRVLIAEACTHAPLSEDIGREKIPALLRKRFGDRITIDIVSGNDWPENLSVYDLIIHCGACMFNRKHVLSRLSQADAANVPMTNYGVFLAHANGILNHILW